MDIGWAHAARLLDQHRADRRRTGDDPEGGAGSVATCRAVAIADGRLRCPPRRAPKAALRTSSASLPHRRRHRASRAGRMAGSRRRVGAQGRLPRRLQRWVRRRASGRWRSAHGHDPLGAAGLAAGARAVFGDTPPLAQPTRDFAMRPAGARPAAGAAARRWPARRARRHRRDRARASDATAASSPVLPIGVIDDLSPASPQADGALDYGFAATVEFGYAVQARRHRHDRLLAETTRRSQPCPPRHAVKSGT